MESEQFTKRLEKYPHLKNRFEEILNIAENTSGLIEEADHAEMMAIEAVRNVGAEMLHIWAGNQEEKKSREAVETKPQVIRHSKKNCIGQPHSGK